MFCFQSLLKSFFLYQKHMLKILPCCNKIYLLWDVSILMRTWGVLIWNSMKGLTFPMLNVMETIKIWSKRKLSEVSQFSISSIGQNRKFGNVGNRHFFFSNHIIKLIFFTFRSFFSQLFGFWVSCTTKSLSKRKLSEISEFSILSIGQNRKLGNLGNWYFFLIKPHHNF